MAQCGTVRVVNPFDPSNVTTGSCQIGSGEITTTESVTVSVEVENANPAPARTTVAFIVDGSEFTTRTNTVEAQSSQTFSADLQLGQLGAGSRSIRTEVSDAQQGGGVSASPRVFGGSVEAFSTEAFRIGSGGGAIDIGGGSGGPGGSTGGSPPDGAYTGGDDEEEEQDDDPADDTSGGTSGGGDSGAGVPGGATPEPPGSEPDPDPEPQFDASSVTTDGCTQPPSEVQPGESGDVGVTIRNPNPAAAAVDVEVTANGQVIGTTSANVSPQGVESQSIRVTFPTSPGDYNVEATVTDASESVSGL